MRQDWNVAGRQGSRQLTHSRGQGTAQIPRPRMVRGLCAERSSENRHRRRDRAWRPRRKFGRPGSARRDAKILRALSAAGCQAGRAANRPESGSRKPARGHRRRARGLSGIAMAIDRRLVYHFDWTLFLMTLGLACLGLLSVLSASWNGPKHALDPLVMRQLVWIGIGTTVMGAAAFFDYRALTTYAYPVYAVTVGLLAAVMVAGHVTGGSRRWLNLGVLRLEPSELAKLALVLVMVRYLREDPPRGGWSFRQMIFPA